MRNVLKKITGGYSSSARVVDGTLILSLPDAVSPVVWRMDLGFVRASAMEVRKEEDGTFMLVLKTPKKDVNEIAPFTTKAKALNALMAVSRAMENAQGQIRPSPAATVETGTTAAVGAAPAKKSKWKKLFTGLFAVILLFMFLVVIINLTPPPPRDFPAGTAEGPRATAPGEDTGVPLSADEFLQNRR